MWFLEFVEKAKGKKIFNAKCMNSDEYFIFEEFSIFFGAYSLDGRDNKGNVCSFLIQEEHEIQNWYILETENKCSCGAKHTSRPEYHLDFCDLYKRGE